MKITLNCLDLTKSIVRQLDQVHNFNDLTPRCRVFVGDEEWIIWEDKDDPNAQPVKSRLNNFINSGLSQHFGDWRNIPKVILVR